MRLLHWEATDVGRVRLENEDSYIVDEELSLFAVADGMGGHAGGKVASSMACQQVRDHLSAHGVSMDSFVGAVLSANSAINDKSRQELALREMGTTFTGVLIHDGRFFLAHVGDSRAYLYRDGVLDQITSDHTWVNEQVRAGRMTPQQAASSRFRHVITRSVGFSDDLQVDANVLPVLPGDVLLLCSDGLTNHLGPMDLKMYVESRFYSLVPDTLVQAANARGGEDNITVVLVYVANDI